MRRQPRIRARVSRRDLARRPPSWRRLLGGRKARRLGGKESFFSSHLVPLALEVGWLEVRDLRGHVRLVKGSRVLFDASGDALLLLQSARQPVRGGGSEAAAASGLETHGFSSKKDSLGKGGPGQATAGVRG
eukprot:scaffold11901_cov96-Isochrysis_galbana.AAC.1